MKYYFIDYENVHVEGVLHIDALEPNVKIFFLYSENCKNISLDIIEKACKKEIQIIAYKTGVGKNALDFQLSSLLGFTIGTTVKEQDEYIIVSKDTGFDCVVEFWRQRNCVVSRICALGENEKPELLKQSSTKSKKKKTIVDIPQATKEELLFYLSANEYSEEILQVVNSYKTRIAINNGFIHLFKDTGKAGVVYNKLKPLLKEKGKT